MLDYYPQKRLLIVDLIGHNWMQGEFPTKEQIIADFSRRNEQLAAKTETNDIAE